MKNFKIGISYVMISSIFFCALTNAKEYTVNELVDLGLSKSKQIESSEFEIKAKSKVTITAGAWENPNLELGVARQEETSGDTRFWSVGISQKLGVPGTYSLRGGVAEIDKKIAEAEGEALGISLKHKLFSSLYAYKGLDEQVKRVGERMKRFGDVQGFLRSRPIASPQKRAEANIVTGKLQVLKLEFFKLKSERDTLWESLNVYFGFEERPNLKPEWFKDGPSYTFDTLVAKLETANPELKKQRLMVENSEKKLSLSRREAWPAPTLSGMYQSGSGLSPEKTYGLGLSIPIPVFNANRSVIGAAEFQKSAESSRLSFVQSRLVGELRSALSRYETAKQGIQALSVSSIKDHENNMKQIDRGFQRGQVDLLTYLESDQQHYEGLSAIFGAQVSFTQHLADILSLVGEATLPSEK